MPSGISVREFSASTRVCRELSYPWKSSTVRSEMKLPIEKDGLSSMKWKIELNEVWMNKVSHKRGIIQVELPEKRVKSCLKESARKKFLDTENKAAYCRKMHEFMLGLTRDYFFINFCIPRNCFLYICFSLN